MECQEVGKSSRQYLLSHLSAPQNILCREGKFGLGIADNYMAYYFSSANGYLAFTSTPVCVRIRAFLCVHISMCMRVYIHAPRSIQTMADLM